MKDKKNNKNKKIFFIVFIFIIIIGLIVFYKNQNTISNIIGISEEVSLDADYSEYEEIGQKAYISSVAITETTTGVGPFDDVTDTDSSNGDNSVTWTAGDDWSEDDNIVRSFDQITWTVENTLSLKDGASSDESYKGGVICIQASVPDDLADLVEWDLDSMAWAENATVSDDGTELTAYYTMTTEDVTVPGKQDLVIVLQVYGASNGTEIVPTFNVSLYGNDEGEKANIKGDEIYVSAAPSYNIKLVRNTSLEKKVTVDYGEDDTSGRMYGYGVILQLYNTDSSKGLKGIEYPTGDITFDINLKLERTLEGSNTTEDITDLCTPILWNYKINENSSNYGVISDRIMYWGTSYHRYVKNAPYGIILSDRTTSVYNSGNISMTQDGSTISSTIYNYDFDGTFPIYNWNYAGSPHISIDYTENIGCFSVGYFQIFVPDNEESMLTDRNYYLTVSDENFSATSISGTDVTEQEITSDDTSRTTHYYYKSGSYSQTLILMNNSGTYLSTTSSSGDGKAIAGQYIRVLAKFGMNSSNDSDIYSATKFIKFDGEAVEPVLFTDGSTYTTGGYDGTMTFNVYYVTKQDGTNWKDTDEMNNANIEDMLVFESIEDIPDGYICVGEYFESNNAGYLATSSGDSNSLYIRLKVKDTATIGKTYEFTQRTKYWLEYVDRDVYSISAENNDFSSWPDTEWDSGNLQYVKTEYDENGEIVSGTHYNGNTWGQSLLIIGADLTVSETAVDESGTEKINYDFSKNEYEATFEVTPNIAQNTYITESITGVTLKITVTLPVGLTYVGGSSNEEYGEPEITENSDGTTTLVWYIYNCTAGEAITPITYTAHIDEESANGTQYETTVVVSEYISDDETYKIGNSEVSNRTYTYDIQVINLSSYSFYKTTETPVIEVNGEVHYKITALNNTDNDVTDFQLLDILPYNGDGRGTSYHGTYTVSQIVITQTNTSTSSEITDNDLDLYVTADESVRNRCYCQRHRLRNNGNLETSKFRRSNRGRIDCVCGNRNTKS